MYLKGPIADSVQGALPSLNLHGRANPRGKSWAAGKSTVYSSLRKRGRFSDRLLAVKPSFILQARKLLDVV